MGLSVNRLESPETSPLVNKQQMQQQAPPEPKTRAIDKMVDNLKYKVRDERPSPSLTYNIPQPGFGNDRSVSV